MHVTLADIGLLVLRLAVGLTFAAHGAQKVFGWWEGPGPGGWRTGVERMGFAPAHVWATIGSTVELLGGLFLALGLLTPIAAAAIIAQSVVIIGVVHLARGFFNQGGGFEFPLLLAAAAVAIALTGPGNISVDEILHVVFSGEIRVGLIVLGLLAGVAGYAASQQGARSRS